MEYLCTRDVQRPVRPALEGDVQTEVLVIGGGMAGVLCASFLREAGVDCLLVEGRTIGSGITKGTTAVLTAQHDTLYQDMVAQSGLQRAQLYLQANLHAVELFRKYAKDCDFEERPSLMYDLRDRQRMEREAAAVRALGFPAEFITEAPLPFSIAGGVRYPGMAQFHPLKFLYEMAKPLEIRENTFVTALEGTTAHTERGTIRAKKVIIATHYPFLNRRGLYFMKLYQKRSFVIALENAPDLGCTIDEAPENGIYLRNYQNLLLVGGGGHRTGKKNGGFSVPRDFARRWFPEAREVLAWANQDCVSLDGVPYIGPYSPNLPDVYVASGFNLWGMTHSMVAAELLTDLVLGRANRFAPAFAPDRPLHKKQLAANLGTTLLSFVTPTGKRCAHLGCALKWNPAERSWDCPCHGSRFDQHGRIIDNPAMKDARVE